MTIALLGVGADSTNSSPTPPVYSDNRFEYIPIPESRGPEGTTESRTFGNSKLRHRDGSMTDYLDYIKPTEDDGEKFTGDRLAEWPLHYDPNFEALTYGESTSRGSYTQVIRSLSEDDVVAFYTGLRGDDTSYTHRYIIGYFTVESIIDFQDLRRDGEEVKFSDLPTDEQHNLIEQHSENAHAKRFEASGAIADNDGLVIVDGKEPGGLLEKAFRISQHSGGGHHYLTDELQQKLSPEQGGNPENNAYLGGIKQAHKLDISLDRFREVVE
jgi:hypothetical protein